MAVFTLCPDVIHCVDVKAMIPINKFPDHSRSVAAWPGVEESDQGDI